MSFLILLEARKSLVETLTTVINLIWRNQVPWARPIILPGDLSPGKMKKQKENAIGMGDLIGRASAEYFRFNHPK